MIEFLNNLFSPGNQQIPVALQNPDPVKPKLPELPAERLRASDCPVDARWHSKPARPNTL
jgi:hypothetical protein